jgi:integrase
MCVVVSAQGSPWHRLALGRRAQPPKRPPKRPVVLTQTEVKLVLEQMSGVYQLVARMLYGTGMRLFECAQLRIKDVALQRREVLVREGKGGKDRITVLPLSLVQLLREQIGVARAIFNQDRARTTGGDAAVCA